MSELENTPEEEKLDEEAPYEAPEVKSAKLRSLQCG